MLFGLLLIIGKHIQFTPVMGFCLTMNLKRRGETFVTRKITRGLTRIVFGLEDCLYLGNLESVRDWGHAKDYVQMQWLMLQQEKPDDYVIASGQQTTVRSFVEKVATKLGIKIEWHGADIEEVGIIKEINSSSIKNLREGQTIIRVSAKNILDLLKLIFYSEMLKRQKKN